MSLIFTGIYIIGFILTLLFFISFGKAIGFDYDQPKTYVNGDDWGSNSEAYTAFSLFWPIVMTMLSIYGFYQLLNYVIAKLIRLSNKNKMELVANNIGDMRTPE